MPINTVGGSALDEPERSDLNVRGPRADLAVQAANQARALSKGDDSVVYWAMGQAYGVKCDIDQLRVAVDRGLQINPNDPSLLGAFGSWLAYNGDWDRGAALVEKAVEIEPQHYRRWWLYATAMRHYERGEYQKAYDEFLRSYNEGNWLSHLQLAFTLPMLGRHEEARESVKKLMFSNPGMTVEKGLQLHRAYCVNEGFLARIKQALTEAGLPSRGSSEDLARVTTPQ